MVRFAITFVGLVLALRWLVSSPPVAAVLNEPLCRGIAVLVAAMLSPFGDVLVEGSRLGFDGFWVVVVDACNGVLPTTIYLSAVLAFPAGVRERLWGVAVGVPAIFALNLVRVASLLVLGAYWPAVFERVHIYVWQTLLVGASMGLWIFWAERFARPASRLGAGA